MGRRALLTWIRLWPLLLLPSFLLTLAVSVPMFEMRGVLLGGGLVRQWLLNHVLLPFAPLDQAHLLVNWFASASVLQEWCLAMLIVLNLNASLLLPLFFVGQSFIKLSAWVMRTELDLKRKGFR